MFKPYWKSKTHVIIFILFLVTLLAPFVYVSAISIYSVANNDPFIVEDEKIILGEAILFGLAIIFTLTFVIDLILYFGNKKAYKRYLKTASDSDCISFRRFHFLNCHNVDFLYRKWCLWCLV